MTPRKRSRVGALRAKAIVRRGWNDRSYLYRPPAAPSADPTGHTGREYRGWLDPLQRDLPRGSRVLDLGCGCGLPTCRLLAGTFQVLGVDISDVQIARARGLVPQARFRRADMTTLRFPARSFEAVVSLYAIIHVPLGEQRALFRRIYRWLVPGGTFLAILGADRVRSIEPGWLGAASPMFWDHADADTYARWLAEAGFVLDERRFVPEGKGGHELFRLRRPLDSRGGRPRRGAAGGPSSPRPGPPAGRRADRRADHGTGGGRKGPLGERTGVR